MGLLTAAALDTLIADGCVACGGKKLLFRTYVAGVLGLLGGEPVTRLGWGYDGEAFLDGVFEVACAACPHILFREGVCPRCHADGGLAKALATENAFPVLASCPRCEGEELKYFAFLPAKVTYEGKRAEKARTTTEMHDPGFHGYQVDCKGCRTVAKIVDRCPLCDAAGPIREQP